VLGSTRSSCWRVADVSSGNRPAWDCFWRSSPAYMEQAMERGQLARSMAGLVFSITALTIGVVMAMIHFALIMRSHFS
ncbi:MAG: hypothetical protein QF689_13380, partial [Candidatus Latescibacteria bacterium]|nr:hypothetical protein [Candidatus Latescibacterota bacterium]